MKDLYGLVDTDILEGSAFKVMRGKGPASIRKTLMAGRKPTQLQES